MWRNLSARLRSWWKKSTKSKRHGVEVKNWNLSNSAFDRTSIAGWNEATEWISKMDTARVTDRAISMLNHLESFAMYFAKGAADEQVAYTAAGAVFCNYVDELSPLLTCSEEKKTQVASGPFQNVVDLYRCWASRMEKENLESQQSKIASALSSIHTSEIPPIGPDSRTDNQFPKK